MDSPEQGVGGVLIRYHELIKGLRKGAILPVYLFYGEEEYLIREAADLIFQRVVEPSTRDFNFNVVYCRESSAHDIVGACQTLPFMAEKRLVVARDIDAFKPPDIDVILQYLKAPSPTTCLVMISGLRKYDKKAVVSAVEAAGGGVTAFYALQEGEILERIYAWAGERGLSMGRDAAQFVVQVVGNDLQKIYSEVEKVEIYVKGGKGITLDDVKRVVGDFREYTPFDLSDAVAGKDIPKALLILNRLLHEGEQPVGLLGSIAWSLRRLLKAKGMEAEGRGFDEIKKRLSVLWLHSASFKKQMSRFTAAELRHAFELLASTDAALKSGGGMDGGLILQRMILRLCRPEM